MFSKKRLKTKRKNLCGRVRMKYKITQSELARVLKMSTQNIYYYEASREKNVPPIVEAILKRMLKIKEKNHIMFVKGAIHSNRSMLYFLELLFGH